MAAKAFLVFCLQALLIQAAFSQYISGNSIVDNTISIGSGLSGYGSSGNFVSGGFGSSYGGSVLTGLSGLSSVSGSGVSTLSGQGLNVVSGGPLLVTSVSPIGPSGLAVASENGLEGVLTVSGQLPFLSAVAFEGALPTAGSGVATCGCGNGEVGILSEGLPATTAPSSPLRAGRRF